LNKISKTDEADDTLEAVDLSPYIEFACWTMMVLFPLLYWVNGPAVSTDQLVVRTALIILAVGGILGSRLAKRKETTVEECKTQTVTEPEDRTLKK
jgi:hypothetical protein